MISTLFWRDWKRSTANGRLNRQRLLIGLVISIRFTRSTFDSTWYALEQQSQPIVDKQYAALNKISNEGPP